MEVFRCEAHISLLGMVISGWAATSIFESSWGGAAKSCLALWKRERLCALALTFWLTLCFPLFSLLSFSLPLALSLYVFLLFCFFHSFLPRPSFPSFSFFNFFLLFSQFVFHFFLPSPPFFHLVLSFLSAFPFFHGKNKNLVVMQKCTE